MSSLLDTANRIKELDVDLNGDMLQEYLYLRDTIDINQYIGYNRSKGYTGFFQIGISVQINAESDFIPFFMFEHSDPTKKDTAREKIKEFVPKEIIKYNYTQFYQDVLELLRGINKYKDLPLSEFFFDIEYSKKYGRYLISNFYIDRDDDNKPTEIIDPRYLIQINNILLHQSNADFIQQLALVYFGLGAKELHFVIVAFDEDCKTGKKLTHIIGVAEDPKEPQDFLFQHIRVCRNLVSLIRTRYMMDLLEKNRHEAIKSAVSAIMSRNMSHNLGSHYMYYTKAYLEKMATSAGDIAPDIRGAAKVLGYVQARMDYLATVISNDKYPYGAVNFKSQLYDELTIDDFSHRHFPAEVDKSKRTTNFLLTNLIYSENFTRPDVRCDEKDTSSKDKLFLYVKYSNDGSNYKDFTGTWHNEKLRWVLKAKDQARIENKPFIPTIKSEQDTKNLLSSLNIALPGGTMSSHAFFNIVENFIRNSAKYLREDISTDNGLVCTLAIKPNTNKKYIDIIIYDNKKNANKEVDSKQHISLYQQILEKLSSLIIIDEHNKISKDNKGFKEILFSSIWMRAYTFGRKTYADIISDINQTEIGERKLEAIEAHGFSLVKVLEENNGNISIFTRNNECTEPCNLGILITLPIFNQTEVLSLSKDRSENINAMLNTMSDIVEVDTDFKKSEFRHVFTHTLDIEIGRHMTPLEKYRTTIKKRFSDIDSYVLSFGENSIAESNFDNTKNDHRIYFQRHINTQEIASSFDDYAYADSISGGNFTITLLDLFKNGIENGHYKTEDDEILALKIKESALTRITIIDERLFNSTKESDYPWLKLKNIRILNYSDTLTNPEDKTTIAPIFIGSNFKDKSNQTHFLSIHLGLIEKILKNSSYINNLINTRLHIGASNEDGTLASNRVTTLMELVKEFFGGNNKDDLYIAVHSGRGNYSAELEGPLSTYPFISLSALENAYNNSKYQLAQLLYNTVYIGKGLANHPQQKINHECPSNHDKRLLQNCNEFSMGKD